MSPHPTATPAFATIRAAVLGLAALGWFHSAAFAQSPNVVAMPAAQPPGTIFYTSLNVTLTTVTPHAVIYYTLDGANPLPGSSAMTYSSPMVINQSTTLKAVAVSQGMQPSPIFEAAYLRIGLPVSAAPILSPASGNFTDTLRVVISGLQGARIHYTLDGSLPTPASPVYEGALILSSTTTVQAIALQDGFTPSKVVISTYFHVPSALRPQGGQAARALQSPRLSVWTWEGRRLDGARP